MKRDNPNARVLPFGKSRGFVAPRHVMCCFVPGFVRALTITAVLVAGAQIQAWAGGDQDGHIADSPHDRTIRARSTTACGEISYDTQGGSLVINRSYEVQPVVQELADDLLAKASEGPFDACLVGDWRGRDEAKFFQARGWGQE